MRFKTWNELFLFVLRDEPGMFYIIKHPTEEDRSRFMSKVECLQFVKDKIKEGGPLVTPL